MKRFVVLILWLIFPVLIYAQQDLDSILSVLDNTVDNYQIYSNLKESRISKLKDSLIHNCPDSRKYEIYDRLFVEYSSYMSDSAIKYAQEKLSIAEKLNDIHNLTLSRLNLVHLLGLMGMFKEALDLLQSIDKNAAPEYKSHYFHTCKVIYGFMSDYASGNVKGRYRVIADAYSDSVVSLTQKDTSDYALAKTDKLMQTKQYDEALKLWLDYYATFTPDQLHKTGYITFLISQLYKNNGDRVHEKYWLAVSSMTDLQTANKSYISLRFLAIILCEDGDVIRAYKYIKRSMDDASFCNARLRTFEIAQVLPVIDKAYQVQIKAHQRKLLISLISISLLSFFLLVAIFLGYRQMWKLAIARKGLGLANEQLSNLNNELFATNSQLKSANKTLLETNLIKEEYIGRYMDQCSMYIDKLDGYRRLLNKTAAAGKMDVLLSQLKSKEYIEDELKKFFYNFDSTFLQLFPTFIKDFASLLVDDEYVQLKPGQLLNTELRIYAIVRLGISDGSKMAQFLRCSISTIYSYRTKIRNKAIDPREEFEAKVLKIGVSIA